MEIHQKEKSPTPQKTKKKQKTLYSNIPLTRTDFESKIKINWK